MRDAALLVATWVLAYLGFAGLALSMERHWLDVMCSAAVSGHVAHRLRSLACFCLAAGLVAACWRDGPAFGGLLWVMSSVVAGIAVAFTLTWRPVMLRPLAACVLKPNPFIEPRRIDDV